MPEAKRGSGGIIVIGELNLDLIATGLETAPVLGAEIIARDFTVTLGSASAIFASGMARLGHHDEQRRIQTPSTQARGQSSPAGA